MKFKFLAVEGPIGVGKTSLVERLAPRFDARQVMENVENPFLEDFYRDRPAAAFQAQLFFLLNRYHQQRELAQSDLFQQLTIADYLFAKDKISEAYINEVNKAYNHFFFHYDATSLLVIDTTDIDFVQREADMDDLVERIESMDRGVQYYVPLGSRE
ncbi:MAG: deoxynucleoside kinase [Acidobacteria bacterium]|nr:MAG: deoxynucleoside kinase [Acidobacteriota bacterium]